MRKGHATSGHDSDKENTQMRRRPSVEGCQQHQSKHPKDGSSIAISSALHVI